MNRHGLKLHLKIINDKLKQIPEIDKKSKTKKFKKLIRRKIMYQNLLKYIHPKKNIKKTPTRR